MQIVLVDGMGWTKVLTLDGRIAPALIEFTPLEKDNPLRPWTGGPVIFDLTRDECDSEGRVVYRQRGTGTPEIRVRRVLPPPPTLRIEGSTEAPSE